MSPSPTISLPSGGAARAEHDEIDRELQVVDVVQSEKAVLRFAPFIEERQDDARQLWMIVVDNPVRGEVDHAIVRQRGTHRSLPGSHRSREPCRCAGASAAMPRASRRVSSSLRNTGDSKAADVAQCPPERVRQVRPCRNADAADAQRSSVPP